MRNDCCKKALVVGIIVLFIGMSVIPCVSGNINEEKNKAVNKSKITSTFNPNSDDDWIVNDQNNRCYKDLKNKKLFNNMLEKGILIVDQAVDSKCGMSTGSHQIRHHMPMGQSFKPLYECHHAIELYIKDLNPNHPLAPIQISLKENNISGPIVPGANVTLNLTSGSGWRFFEFFSPINLTINQTYVIDISTTTNRWGDKNTQGFCYDRGIQYLEGAPSIGSDLYFRTYVLWPYPTANFTYQPINPVKYDLIYFYDESNDNDGYIVSWLWDFGDGNISTIQNPTHQYTNIGTYVVTLNVTDNDGLTDEISKNITVIPNNPPNTPVIEGKRRFREGEGGIYPYTIYSVDPDDDDLFYLIYWSNGTEDWIGPYPSGENFTIDVAIPLEKGTYVLFKIRAIDIFGAESDWAILEVIVPRNKATYNPLFHWFLERFPLLGRFLNLIQGM